MKHCLLRCTTVLTDTTHSRRAAYKESVHLSTLHSNTRQVPVVLQGEMSTLGVMLPYNSQRQYLCCKDCHELYCPISRRGHQAGSAGDIATG